MEFHTCKGGYVDPDLPKDILMEVFHRLSDDEGKGAEVDRLTRAIIKKVDNDHYYGAPKFGTQYFDDKTTLVAGDNFATAMEVLNLREQDCSYRDIRDETGCALPQINRVLEDVEVYRVIESECRWKAFITSERSPA